MQRCPDGALLDEMARAGTLTAMRIVEAADRIAAFHAAAPPRRESGDPHTYRGFIDGLRRTEQHGAAAWQTPLLSQQLFPALETAMGRSPAHPRCQQHND